MNETLADSPALMRTLLESAGQGILIVNPRGEIVLANARAEELFGCRRESLLGRPIGDLLPERYRAAHRGYCAGYMQHPRQRAMGAGQEIFARRQDGSEFPADISLGFAEVGGALYAMCLIDDASARVEAQKTMRAYSERLEAEVEARTQELRQAQARLLDQQLVQRDLELAQQVQASLLPRQVPVLDGFEFAAQARPARYVSGDLYDFFPCTPEVCHFVLADIAGKGVPAALLASTARTLVHGETAHESAPAAILSNIERALQADLEQAEAFITVMAARLDARLGRLSYANAGHTEALWYRGGACQRLPATGLPLGIGATLSRGDTALQEKTIYVRPGDVLVFYSDGITEATDARGEMYGLARLADVVRQNVTLPARELADAIVGRVEAYRDGPLRADDLTLLVLKALPRDVELTAPAGMEHLREIVALVRQCALAYGEEPASQVELAASEIVTNIIEHACDNEGQIRVRIALSPLEIRIDLYDDGGPCDLASIPAAPLGELQQGGYGLHIARQLLDELSYTVDENGNHWRLLKTIPEKKEVYAPH